MLADCAPTEDEKPVWEGVQAVLNQTDSILQQLRGYKGAANEIRQVWMTRWTEENMLLYHPEYLYFYVF